MTPNTNAALREFAEGRIQHLNRGQCPDIVSGHDSRDPDCPVCAALTTAAAVPAASRHSENVALLADILNRRPAMNAGLVEAYATWTQEVYDLMGSMAAEPANDDSLAAAPKAESVPACKYPALPAPFIGVQDKPWGGHAEVIRSAIGEDGVVSCYTADQMRAYVDADRAMRAQAAPADPLDTPLPCDLTAGGVTIGKGCPLRTVQHRLQVQADANVLLMRTKAAPAVGLKDHEIAALVNRLRDVASQFRGTRQLRERIASEIRPVAHALAAPAAQGDASWPQLRSALAMAMLGWGCRQDQDRTIETCYTVLDAITEPGMPLALLRTAPDWRYAAHSQAKEGA